MSEPKYWDIKTRLSGEQLRELERHRFKTREEFLANVMRRVELNGATVVGSVANAFGNQINFDFTGPGYLMNEAQALIASIEIIGVLMTGTAITPDDTTVTETILQ